ncbi:penicillin-binding protein, partial [Streptomyces cavourensis]|nr:penicillin-binding protein [Streptomyces cavourensis]
FNVTIGGQYYPKVCGGCLPGPIWKIAMTGALDAAETPSFNPVSVPRAKEKEDKEKGDGDREGGRDRDGDREDGKPGRDRTPGIQLPPGLIGGPGGGEDQDQRGGGRSGP